MRKIPIVVITTIIIFLFYGVFSQPSKYEGKIVKKIEFQGLDNINPADLNEIIRTSVGYPLKAVEVRKDIKDIFEKGKFENVTVEIQEFQDGVQIRFICKERAIVKSIEFKGAEELIESDLTTTILLKEGDALRKDYIEKSIKALKEKYKEEGLFNSVITYKIEKIKGIDKQVKVIFIIDEGEEIAVRKISILGAKKIYSKELLSFMETSEKSILKDGTFQVAIYEQDKAKIIAYYKQKGYLDAQIIEDLVEYEWVNPEKKDERGIFITIKLTEGDLYYFDKYTIKINGEQEETVFNPEDFIKDFELKKTGAIFNNTLFLKDRQMISFKYATKGYIFTRVIPKRTITEREVKVKGKMVKRKFVRIDFEIEEGSQAYIDQIIIKGNKKTKDFVIKRELLFKEGELFDSRKMQLSRERVYNLGFFKQVNMDLRPGSREGYMNLIVDVEEQPTGTISLGGGYGTTSGFSIFADIGENNLLGYGQRIGVKFEYGPLRSSITLSFTERWLGNYPIGLDASVFYYIHSIEDTPIFKDSDVKASYKIQSFGYSLGLSYRFLYFFTVGNSWSHSFKSYLEPSGASKDEIFKTAQLGIQEKRTLSYYIFHDSRDNYMNPTKGARLGLTVSFTGGVVLGGDDHFVKYSPKFSFYFSPFHIPMLKSHPIVFEFRASGAFVTPPYWRKDVSKDQNYNRNPWLEPDDRLTIGGVETLRGWDYYDSKFPESWKQGLYHRILWGFEMRIPLHPQMLWFALFIDAGSLWSDKYWEGHADESMRNYIDADIISGDLKRIQDFTKVSLLHYFKYSYGFGFRIQIPMMPLRFWFGRKVVYRRGEFKQISGFTFQFGIGDMRF